jgi:hypothetical protein
MPPDTYLTLDDWIRARGKGEHSRLVRATGLTWSTILRARQRRASLGSAMLLSRATDGAVPVHAMTPRVPAVHAPSPRVRAAGAA